MLISIALRVGKMPSLTCCRNATVSVGVKLQSRLMVGSALCTPVAGLQGEVAARTQMRGLSCLRFRRLAQLRALSCLRFRGARGF